MTNTKRFFRESEANVETLLKHFPYLWVSYKFVLKSVKSLNRILWTTEYWFKALKCKIWLTTTQPYFSKSKANVETLQKRSPYIGVSYKFVLKSVKSLNWILWATEYWFKALVEEYKTSFLGKQGRRWSSSKTFLWLLLFRMIWMLNSQLSNIKLEIM